MEPILSVKDLSVSFNAFAGKVHAVRDVNFDLYKGETLAIVGESGSGKSVTTKAILGILAKNGHIDSGTIMYQGQDMAKYKEADFYKIRGKRISLVFQDPLSALNPIMKIGKQITEALILSKAIEKSKAKARAIELMEAVGIPNAAERYDAYPFQISGGMRQRIVIAIALASNPEILICDEPTTALDVTIQAQIINLIQNLQKEYQMTVVFITHDLGVVAHVADRVAVMYAGQIVEYGMAEEIFYDAWHPYTWALMSSLPQFGIKGEPLPAIEGTPPNLFYEVKGDAFAPRNKQPLAIDFKEEPPFFELTPTHKAKTWYLDPRAPKIRQPEIFRMLRENRMGEGMYYG